MRIAIASLSLSLVACSPSQPAPQPPPTLAPGPAPVAATTPDADAADAPTTLYRCRQPVASGSVKIELRSGYTATDVAQWLIAWSCRRVVLARELADRAAPTGFRETVAVADLPATLSKLLVPLSLVAVSEGTTTVFVDADPVLASDGPALVIVGTAPAPTAPTTGPPVSTAPTAPTTPTTTTAPTRKPPATWPGITQKSPTSVTITRAALDKILKDPVPMARGVRLVPSIKNGKSNGFKLYAIRPSSLFAALGFKNGDSVHRINGHDLSSPEKALEVYTKVRKAKTLRVEMTRRKKPMTMTIRIVDGAAK